MAIDDGSESPDTILEQNLEQPFANMADQTELFSYTCLILSFFFYVGIPCSMLLLGPDSFLNLLFYLV